MNQTENKGTSPKDSYGTEGEEAMKKFKDKWETWTPEQKLDTLLNMILGIGYRIDILASVVSGIPEVEKMEAEAAKAAAANHTASANGQKG